ncbi:hypothetical protein A6R68_15870, partial [Neotoma lepida]
MDRDRKNRVFHSNETTKNVYEEIAVPIINSAIQGYNGTIFAYGQTASGKTHTMMGSEDCLGVIPRAIHDIFQRIKKFPEREFLLRVSYMEIYNETITDLLCNAQKMKPLIIREDINNLVDLAGSERAAQTGAEASFDETLTTLQVNTKTRAQEMEKDQLAQLLDEKDLLQKVQDEKIQNLKRMLVTSSSIALQQELK